MLKKKKKKGLSYFLFFKSVVDRGALQGSERGTGVRLPLPVAPVALSQPASRRLAELILAKSDGRTD